MPMRFDGFESLLSFQARSLPHAPALVYERGEEQQVCTYGELFLLIQQRAKALRAAGCHSLGVLCDGSFSCIIEIFAAVLGGKRVSLFNENTPDELLFGQVASAQVDCLWGDGELCEVLSPYIVKEAPGGAGQILFFTSGTTSVSKAVVLTDKSLMASAYNGSALLPLTQADRLLCLLPLDHVFGFVCGLLWGLSCGAAVALGRGPRHYGDDCGFFKPTALSAVPLLLGFLLQHRAINPELQLVLVGAGGCPPAILQGAKAMGLRVHFGYGLTETSSGVALSLGEDPYAMTVCPEDTLSIAPDGEVLIYAPTCLMQGYWQHPEDTAAAVKNGVLYTGDVGRLDEQGRLILTGRKKEMLVLPDGTKLFLPEYEGAIREALGREGCIVEGKTGPILLLEGVAQDTAPLWEKLLPLIRQRPRSQQIVKIDFYGGPLPRTASGKIMRWAIQRKGEQP
ncbi:MAG: acyl--CoA ligase [Clostridia bacterium]|nr:acyl--CoA ligase [Clostridia bacterium]